MIFFFFKFQSTILIVIDMALIIVFAIIAVVLYKLPVADLLLSVLILFKEFLLLRLTLSFINLLDHKNEINNKNDDAVDKF